MKRANDNVSTFLVITVLVQYHQISSLVFPATTKKIFFLKLNSNLNVNNAGPVPGFYYT